MVINIVQNVVPYWHSASSTSMGLVVTQPEITSRHLSEDKASNYEPQWERNQLKEEGDSVFQRKSRLFLDGSEWGRGDGQGRGLVIIEFLCAKHCLGHVPSILPSARCFLLVHCTCELLSITGRKFCSLFCKVGHCQSQDIDTLPSKQPSPSSFRDSFNRGARFYSGKAGHLYSPLIYKFAGDFHTV